MSQLLLAFHLFFTTPVTAPAPFHLVLTRTSNGWSAACDSGCSWTEVSASCILNCRVAINNDGISGPTSDRSHRFAFTVERAGLGWTATAVNGTDWTSLSWGCVAGRECKAILDRSGVRAVDPKTGR